MKLLVASLGINEKRTLCLDSSPLVPLILTCERGLMLVLIL